MDGIPPNREAGGIFGRQPFTWPPVVSPAGTAGRPDARVSTCARCRAVDLNRWLQGAYAIPGRPPGGEDE